MSSTHRFLVLAIAKPVSSASSSYTQQQPLDPQDPALKNVYVAVEAEESRAQEVLPYGQRVIRQQRWEPLSTTLLSFDEWEAIDALMFQVAGSSLEEGMGRYLVMATVRNAPHSPDSHQVFWKVEAFSPHEVAGFVQEWLNRQTKEVLAVSVLSEEEVRGMRDVMLN